jgi:S-(hydroxymethyl)glutathione dehydrogenase/alcohol dehydrogenase
MSVDSLAVVTDGAGSLSVASTTIDEPVGDEVLVKLHASGVCHPDLDSLKWGVRMVLGHEGAGEVVAAGDDSPWSPGTRVVLNWTIPCGRCFFCTRAKESLCEDRTARDPREGTTRIGNQTLQRSFSLGTMSEYALVRSAALQPYPATVSPAAAALVGCAAMTGWGSVVNIAQVQPGEHIAVLGIGGVGINVVQAARRCGGAGSVVAIDRSHERLELALRYGATHVILVDSSLDPALEVVRHITGGRGADAAFECTGVPALAAAPLSLIRNGGRAIQVSGNETVEPIDLRAFEWDKTYINPLYGGCRPAVHTPLIFEEVVSGRIELEGLITTRRPLVEVDLAFEDLRSGQGLKTVLQFDK